MKRCMLMATWAPVQLSPPAHWPTCGGSHGVIHIERRALYTSRAARLLRPGLMLYSNAGDCLDYWLRLLASTLSTDGKHAFHVLAGYTMTPIWLSCTCNCAHSGIRSSHTGPTCLGQTDAEAHTVFAKRYRIEHEFENCLFNKYK